MLWGFGFDLVSGLLKRVFALLWIACSVLRGVSCFGYAGYFVDCLFPYWFDGCLLLDYCDIDFSVLIYYMFM